MTFEECEIIADAACHLKAIGERMHDPANVREISYVLGMLATLPLANEPEATPASGHDRMRICKTCGRTGRHFYLCGAAYDLEPLKHSARV